MANRLFLTVFVLSQFASAFLLFLVQPIAAKMLLPTLGGTAAVWNTSVFFFQVTLLLGYSYAHLSIKFLSNRQQRILHLAVLGLGMLSLPIVVGELAPPEDPLFWILGVLFVMVAAPFFALSATAPLFQAWFVQSDHPERKNPYQLYAASNVGSILALLLYPVVFERVFPTQTQSSIWSISYFCFFVIAMIVVAITWKFSKDRPTEIVGSVENTGPPISWSQRLLWVVYALIPSSLVLGVTTHISLNIGSVPLFWVVPLAIYLLTFIISFSSSAGKFSKIGYVAGPAVTAAFFVELLDPVWMFVAVLHLAVLFILSMSFHSKLVEAVPRAENLTEFYLFISLGGVLGASFNAIFAPTFFSNQYEYYIVLGASILILYDKFVEGLPSTVKGFTITSIIVAISTVWFAIRDVEFLVNYWDMVFALLFLLAILFRSFPDRRKVLAKLILAVWAVILTAGLGPVHVHQDRSFYSTLVVDVKKEGARKFHALANGNTVHGLQEQGTDTLIPLSYYHHGAGMGDVFTNRQNKDAIRVGVVGLGIGALAAYNRPNDQMDFFEIDSAVVDIANNTTLFTYLSAAKGYVDIVIGDGRLKLKEYSGPTYDLLVIDAFTSNAIPTFLLTKEAVEIFMAKLNSDGLLVFHVSSRSLDLAPILGKISEHLGYSSRVLFHQSTSDDIDAAPPSIWVMIAREDASLNTFGDDWAKIDVGSAPLWTDAHHNILSARK